MSQNNTESVNVGNSIIIDNVEIFLSKPDELDMQLVGSLELKQQLMACWLILDKSDIPLTPRILGKPGVGKTTLAYCVGKSLGKEVYIFQCTMDTRPEDLIITPVIADNNKIRYHASPLVSAMIRGGVVILDEGNRMMEKAWASLAPLFDRRRYVESITAGIKIKAHPDFRCAVTMNNDSSTFEIPEYIISRLQPQIFLDFPAKSEEREILKVNVPFVESELIELMVDFLERSHNFGEPFTSRDGIHILRYTKKLMNNSTLSIDNALSKAIVQILGTSALRYLSPDGNDIYQNSHNFSEDVGNNDDEYYDDEDDEYYDDEDDEYYDDEDDDEYFDDEDEENEFNF